MKLSISDLKNLVTEEVSRAKGSKSTPLKESLEKRDNSPQFSRARMMRIAGILKEEHGVKSEERLALEDTFSDMEDELTGHRPSGEFLNWSDEELQAEIDALRRALNREIAFQDQMSDEEMERAALEAELSDLEPDSAEEEDWEKLPLGVVGFGKGSAYK